MGIGRIEREKMKILIVSIAFFMAIAIMGMMIENHCMKHSSYTCNPEFL